MPTSRDSGAKITLKTLHTALKQRYPRATTDLPIMDEQTLLQTIAELPVDAVPGNSSVQERIQSANPDYSLHDDHYLVISFLDDCCSTVLRNAEFPDAIQNPLGTGVRSLIRAAITEGLTNVSRSHGVLDVLDQLIKLAIGWTDTSDKLNTTIKEQIESSIASLSIVSDSKVSDPKVKTSRDTFLDNLATDIKNFHDKEQQRVHKLEERLVASETGLLKTNRARNLAAQMLNENMDGNPLPGNIIDFLQGPWYDSLQLILVRQGLQSEDWFRATKLTETLIWTFQFENQEAPDSIDEEYEALESIDEVSDEVPTDLLLSETNDSVSIEAVDISAVEEVEFDANARVAFNLQEENQEKEGEDDQVDFSIQDSSVSEPEPTSTKATFQIDDSGDIEDIENISFDTENFSEVIESANSDGTPPSNSPFDGATDEEHQKLYRIIEHLPDELKELLVSLEYQADSKNSELAAIESAHVSIITGDQLTLVPHVPLACDPDFLGSETAISQSLLAEVNKIDPGQWFVFEPQDQPPQHIKLVLKLDDLQQLLFTNRNGLKVLQTSFDEFAYFLSSEFARAIPSTGQLSSFIRTSLNKIVSDYVENQQSAKQAKSKSEVRQAVRRAARIKAMAEANSKLHEAQKLKEMQSTQMFLTAIKEKAHTKDNEANFLAAEKIFNGLNVGAWMKLPGIGRKPTECKLAVKLQAQDKYIFVDRTGLKQGEFNKQQLIELLVVKECTILESESGFEDALETVVSGLRKHRSLDYDNE